MCSYILYMVKTIIKTLKQVQGDEPRESKIEIYKMIRLQTDLSLVLP